MAAQANDRNLLFGILAWQMNFVSRTALLAAMQAWVFDRDTPLGVLLRTRGELGEEEYALLDALVRKHLEKHGDDPAQSLAALREPLLKSADAELQASFAQVCPEVFPATRDPLPEELPAPARFRVLRPHARGGLGQVSVALDAELTREVALKEIQDRYADDPQSQARFLLEAEITGALEHPGIVPVYSLGRSVEGRPYYAMRFIRGASLQEAISRYHALPAGEPGQQAVELRKLLGRFLDVCNAIAYAHNRGVLHRDIKPGNVMLGEFGETLVVDWGLAKVLKQRPEETSAGGTTPPSPPLQPRAAEQGAPTQMGDALGTPDFMSPEQAEGRIDRLGPASDVYSLGATLYVLLTGQSAFRGPTWEVLRKVQRGEFQPPRQVRREVPPALDAICLKAMALKPEDRYPSARALADDLERWLADEPTSAYRESWQQRFARWARRHRTTVVAGVVSVVLTVAAGVGGLWLWSAAEQQRQDQDREHLTALQTAAEADERLALLQLQTGRWESTREILEAAIQRLDGEPRLAALQQRLERFRAQARALTTFQERSARAHLFVMLESDREAQASVEEALRAVRALQHEDWLPHLPEMALTEGQQKRLREDVFRQLLILAGLIGKQGVAQFRSKEAASTYREALTVVARARQYRESVVTELMELFCHLGLGEWDKLRLPRKQPESAADHLFLGMMHAWLEVSPSHAFSGFLARFGHLFGGHPILDLKTPLRTAEKHLRRAVELDPEYYWGHLLLCGTLLLSDAEKAELSFNACLGLQPHNVAIFLARADVRMRRMPDRTETKKRAAELEQALADLNEAVRRDPRNPLVYILRTRCHENRQDLAAALVDADRAVQLLPASTLALEKRSGILLKHRQVAGALRDATACLDMDPSNFRALETRAEALAELGNPSAAVANLKEALRLDPWRSSCACTLALLCLRQGDRAAYDKQVLALLGQTESQFNEYRYTWTIRAAQSVPHSPEVAQRFLTLARRRLVTKPATSFRKAIVSFFLFRTGQVAEAAKELEQSLNEVDGFDPLRWLYLALAQHRLNQPVAARGWLQKAIAFMEDRPGPATQSRAFREFEWCERLELELLRREVEETLNGRRDGK